MNDPKIRVKCGWCGEEIIEGVNDGSLKDSGLCDACFKMRDYYHVKVEELDQIIDYPVLIVDDNMVVKEANKPAVLLARKDVDTIKNSLCGNVLNCIYSEEEGGCGKTEHCMGCVIRNSTNETFSTGKPMENQKSFHYIRKNGDIVEMEITLSTKMMGDHVLLSINRVRPVA